MHKTKSRKIKTQNDKDIHKQHLTTTKQKKQQQYTKQHTIIKQTIYNEPICRVSNKKNNNTEKNITTNANTNTRTETQPTKQKQRNTTKPTNH